jgi:NAD(P)-dependent dehydrogenase (short-subunit alcohol dehydrogenase family)
MAFDRPASADEIAWTVAFMASPRSSYTSGIYITVDGGIAARS